MTKLSEDSQWMQKALELAIKPDGQTRPNPQVGCVIVKGDKLIGQGFHEKAGKPHAERVALEDCRVSTEGATAYVTLEPCNHQGRTPPCVDALLDAKIKRVVIAQSDPNPEASGGVEKLRNAGVEVVTGVLESEVRKINRAFTKFHETKMPFVTLKWAMSLDGVTSAPNGDSKWITSPESRKQVHRQRAQHDAILVGIETALKDQAALTVRDWPLVAEPPKRIIADSQLRLPIDHPILDTNHKGQVILFCSGHAPEENQSRLEDAGATIIRVDYGKEESLDVQQLLQELAKLKVMSVYVEGGRRLAGSFLKQKLVDQVIAFVAPRIIGSAERSTSAMRTLTDVDGMDEALDLKDIQIEVIDEREVIVRGFLRNEL